MFKLSGGSKEFAEGAAFSAAILPRIHACDATAAKTISDNMNMEIAENARMSAGFAAVKKAFESTYTCLGMTCAHVGGLILQDAEYYGGAGPCEDGHEGHDGHDHDGDDHADSVKTNASGSVHVQSSSTFVFVTLFVACV